MTLKLDLVDGTLVLVAGPDVYYTNGDDEVRIPLDGLKGKWLLQQLLKHVIMNEPHQGLPS